MANIDAPMGLELVGHISGSPHNARVISCYVPSSYGTALFRGDPVEILSSANTTVVKSGLETHGIGTLPIVQKAQAGDTKAFVGSIVSVEPIVRDSGPPYNPASTERVLKVCVDPEAIYRIQANGSVAATDIGTNANLVYDHSGSTATGRSGAELNTASMTTTATYQLKILSKASIPGRDELGTNWPVLLVKINNHQYAHATASPA